MKSTYHDEGTCDEEEEPKHVNSGPKKSNILPLWGNDRTMNLNPLILTNIQSSHYFKVNLYELKTYHEVIDEIYYKVAHLEPWEKGSRKTAGQTGMCGGVRGVGAGGIVSTAYCLLYKLFTLKLTRKQLNGLITHPDSPYIRALGFMYIRYTQPPADLWDWYDEYLDDNEELDVKAGGGQFMTIGNILKNFLCKLEWFSTLFPRIPVPIQQKIEKNMSARYPAGMSQKPRESESESRIRDRDAEFRRATERDRTRLLDDRRRTPERRRSSEDRRSKRSSEERRKRHSEERRKRSSEEKRRHNSSSEHYRRGRSKERHHSRHRTDRKSVV